MSVFKEALEWERRAEQAREVAGQLTDPGAKRAMLQAAKGYEYLARTAAERAVLYGQGGGAAGAREGHVGSPVVATRGHTRREELE
jgi:hypothetical protein